MASISQPSTFGGVNNNNSVLSSRASKTQSFGLSNNKKKNHQDENYKKLREEIARWKLEFDEERKKSARFVKIVKKMSKFRQKMNEDLDWEKLKAQREKNELEGKHQEDRFKRGNEIIALKNENERLITDRFKFTAFVRNLANHCGISFEDDIDIVSASFLENLSGKLLEKRSAECAELIRSGEPLKPQENSVKTCNTPKTFTTGKAIPRVRHQVLTFSEPLMTPPITPSTLSIRPHQKQKNTSTPGPSGSRSSSNTVVKTSPFIFRRHETSRLPVDTFAETPIALLSANSVEEHSEQFSASPKYGGGVGISVPASEELNQHPPTPIASTSTSKYSAYKVNCVNRNGQAFRKSQPDFLRKTRHASLRKAFGFWYCSCGRKFSSARNRTRHVNFLKSDWKLKCQHCHLKFYYLGNLKRHIFKEHATAVKIILPKETRSQHEEVDPLLINQTNSQRKYFCLCGKAYLHKGSLTRHIQTKKYGPIYRCSLCYAKYVYTQSLKIHMSRIHGREYEGFECARCGDAFSSKSSREFKNHLERNHSAK